MFTIKRGIFSNKGDNSKLIFARIIPVFGPRVFSEKAAKAECCHPACGALIYHFTIFHLQMLPVLSQFDVLITS